MTDFDHARSTQTISIIANAVVQDVMSRDGGIGQIALIRTYLRAQAEAFAHGGILLPAGASQDETPGIVELQAGTTRATVQFEETLNGGRLIYETKEPLLWQALCVLTGQALREQGVETGLNLNLLPETPVLRKQPP